MIVLLNFHFLQGTLGMVEMIKRSEAVRENGIVEVAKLKLLKGGLEILRVML